MIDFADAINQISQGMSDVNWRILGLVSQPNMDGFVEQKTEMPLFPIEFVKSVSDGFDGFYGDIYLPSPYKDGDCQPLYVHIAYEA